MNFCIKLDLGVGFFRCGLAVSVDGDTVTVRDMESSSKDRATFPLHCNSAWAELVNFAEEGKVVIVPVDEYDGKLSAVKGLTVTRANGYIVKPGTIDDVGSIFPRAEEYNTKEDFRFHHFGGWCNPAAVFIEKIVKLDQKGEYQVFADGKTFVLEYSESKDWQDGRQRIGLKNIVFWDFFPDGRVERHIADAEAYRAYRMRARPGTLMEKVLTAIKAAGKEPDIRKALQQAFPLWEL